LSSSKKSGIYFFDVVLWWRVASLQTRNAVSSFLSFGWLSLLSILTIPVYIRLLGVEEWGLVAACASLQILSNFIDAGFSQIVPRWAAGAAHDREKLQSYVKIFRKFYLALGLVLFLLMQASARNLAEDWFQIPINRSDELELAIRIVSFQFLFQFLNNLHISIWHGLQYQIQANVRVSVFGTLKHAVTLVVLLLCLKLAWMYALAFAAVAFVEFLVNAISVNRMLGKECPGTASEKIDWLVMLREVSMLSAGIFVGLVASQLDRIILSRSVDVTLFGIYTVVATLAFAFLQLQTPFTRAYFPLIVADIHSIGRVTNQHIRRLLGGTLITSTLPALLACIFARHILVIWLHDEKMVEFGTAPLRLLLLAVSVNSIYGCIYQVIIAAGEARRVLQFNLVSIVAAILVAVCFHESSGLLLGGFIWLSITVIQLILGATWYGARFHYGNHLG